MAVDGSVTANGRLVKSQSHAIKSNEHNAMMGLLDTSIAKSQPGPACPPRSIQLRWLTILFPFILIYRFLYCPFNFDAVSWSRDHQTDKFPPSIFHHLGQYSPYFPVSDYPPLPTQCTIEQVNILQRHGARYPTKGAASYFRDVVKKLNKAKPVGEHGGEYAWLKEYQYDLGQEDLVPLGIEQ